MEVPQLNSILPDANILVSQTLHSWIALIAIETQGSWCFYYTEDILNEAGYHRRKRYPETASKQIEDLRGRLIHPNGPFKRIANFSIDSNVTYPDEFDAHVHSAAIHGNVGIILTNDKKGFKGLYKDPDDCPYEVYSADEFLMLVAESAPSVTDAVIKQQQEYWKSCYEKGKSISLPKKLRKAECNMFADYVCKRLQALY